MKPHICGEESGFVCLSPLVLRFIPKNLRLCQRNRPTLTENSEMKKKPSHLISSLFLLVYFWIAEYSYK